MNAQSIPAAKDKAISSTFSQVGVFTIYGDGTWTFSNFQGFTQCGGSRNFASIQDTAGRQVLLQAIHELAQRGMFPELTQLSGRAEGHIQVPTTWPNFLCGGPLSEEDRSLIIRIAGLEDHESSEIRKLGMELQRRHRASRRAAGW